VCIAAFNSACCVFVATFYTGHGQSCLCPRSSLVIGNGVTFPSRDGCYIYRLFSCCASGVAGNLCSCKIDNNMSSGTNACFNSYVRPYQTKINRINPCVVQHKGFCCVKFDDWECNVLGCTIGTDTRRNTWSSDINMLGCLYTLSADPNAMKDFEPKVIEISTNNYSSCLIRCKNLDEAHHVVWSQCCCQKAILISEISCTLDTTIGLFDCTLDSMDVVYSLSYLNSNSFVCNLVGAYGLKPCCMTGSSPNISPSQCFLAGGTTAACRCAWRNCLCTVTGNKTLSLMHKCLGYSMAHTCGTTCMSMQPIAGDSSFSTVHNRENDHLVLFRAIGYGCNAQCMNCVTWMGAICWDIHNRCISKVNTIYPPSPDGALQYQKNSYWCNIECAKANSSYNQGCMALPVCSYLFLKETWCCCFSTPAEGIRALPYGNINSYRDSGCTDSGGFYVAGGLGCTLNYEVCATRCSQTAGTNDPYYYSCTASACQVYGPFCQCIMLVRPMQKYLAKVPFSKPLECVGFRSEPELAKMMNSIAAPAECANHFTNLSSIGSVGHKCLTCCACACSFRMPPQNLCQSMNCFSCGPYGTCDCLKWQKTTLLITPTTQVRLGCCLFTGVSTGTYCNLPFCCYTEYFKNCNNFSCAQHYKCLQPCHFSKNETSKRYIYPYIESRACVKESNYGDFGSRISCRLVPLNTGEDPYERFHRQWNEDVIECC